MLLVFALLTKLINLKSKVNLKHSNQQSFKMGTKQSSLAKSASTEQNEETPKLEVKSGSERGLMIVNQNIVEVSSEEEFDTESDTDDDSEDESDDEEGMLLYCCTYE